MQARCDVLKRRGCNPNGRAAATCGKSCAPTERQCADADVLGTVGNQEWKQFRNSQGVVRAAAIGPVGFIHRVLHALRMEVSVGKRVDGHE